MSSPDTVSSETDLIQSFLAPLAIDFPGAFSLGDDCAVVDAGPGCEMVVTVDAVAAGVHFFEDDAADDIAWKALAVNASDLAAKGAEPFAYVMSLAFPSAPTRSWMAEFARGLGEAQTSFGMSLAGGDTDRRDGPLSITITAFGRVPAGHMIPRSGGVPGDVLCLSGSLGDSALGLALRHESTTARWRLKAQGEQYLRQRYLRPQPRLGLRAALRRHAKAAIDLSDGLAKDVATLARMSGTGAIVDCGLLPFSGPVRGVLSQNGISLSELVAAGGDYEVLAAVPPQSRNAFIADAKSAGVAVTAIGSLTQDETVLFRDKNGARLNLDRLGHDHLAGS